ncbi:Protein of unknown function [Gryllus bimaculatus]|nr:Protein of unknown function [Gryllus bimaculatus]
MAASSHHHHHHHHHKDKDKDDAGHNIHGTPIISWNILDDDDSEIIINSGYYINSINISDLQLEAPHSARQQVVKQSNTNYRTPAQKDWTATRETYKKRRETIAEMRTN